MRYRHILPRDELFEVNMSPTSLQKLVAAIPGAKAGLEFEMCVPDVSVADSDYDSSEPDYEMDERCRDIDDAVTFFYDGDFNSRSTVNRLRDAMYEDYHEWQSEQLNDLWQADGLDYLSTYIRENASSDEWLKGHEGEDEDAAFEEYVNESWTNHGDYYDSAREEFEQEHRDEFTDRDWLEEEDINTMGHVEDHWSGIVTWPHWTHPEEDGGFAIDEVAKDFSNYVGRDVVNGGGYHDLGGSERSRLNADAYIVEVDSSINAKSGDAGLEFVSPPLSIPEMMQDLKKIAEWTKARDCYTGLKHKTGLHMNISVPGYDEDNLDYLKLAILLGDEHVLRSFERLVVSGLNYAVSSMQLIRDRIEKNPETTQKLLDQLKGHLDHAASKVIHSGATQKYTSINVQNNRVEFRGPGGDWIRDLQSDPAKIPNTIMRMVVALDAACDPEKYKKEYQTKLYKLLNPKGQNDEYGDMLNEFAKYVSHMGGAPEQVVKDFRRLATSTLQSKRNPDQWYEWHVYGNPNSEYQSKGISVTAQSEADAFEEAAAEWKVSTGSMNNTEYYQQNKWRAIRVKPVQGPAYSQEWKIKRGDTVLSTFMGPDLNQPDAYKIASNMAIRWLKRNGKDPMISPGGYQVAAALPNVAPKFVAWSKNMDRPFGFGSEGQGVIDQYLISTAPDLATAQQVLDQYMDRHGITNTNDYEVRDAGDVPQDSARAASAGDGEARQEYDILDANGRKVDRMRFSTPRTQAQANEWLADSSYRVGGRPPDEHAVGPFSIVPSGSGQSAPTEELGPFYIQDPIDNSVATLWQRNSAANAQRYADFLNGQHHRTGMERLVVRQGVPPSNAIVRTPGSSREAASSSPVPSQPRQTTQATAPNGVPLWEVYERDSGHVVYTFADHDQTTAWSTAQRWLRTYAEPAAASNFSCRPKMVSR